MKSFASFPATTHTAKCVKVFACERLRLYGIDLLLVNMSSTMTDLLHKECRKKMVNKDETQCVHSYILCQNLGYPVMNDRSRANVVEHSVDCFSFS